LRSILYRFISKTYPYSGFYITAVFNTKHLTSGLKSAYKVSLSVNTVRDF